MAQNNSGQQLSDLLVTRGYDPEMLDSTGKAAPAAQDAEIFSFDFITANGTNHGSVVVMLGDDNELTVFSGDNVGRNMDSEDKTEWYEFQHQLKNFATKNFMTFGSQNINKLKYSMQGQAALKEGLCESWNGTKNVSWNGGPDSVRLMIRHKRPMGTDEARFRQVESLFVETADGERHRLSFRSLAGGRAMVEHVRQGGKPYDMRGQHIATIIEELNVLSRFRRASKGQVFEGDTANLVAETNRYYETMCRTVKGLSSSKGYNSYFESWNPGDITEQDLIIEDIKTLFVQETIDSRIEQALPILARIQQQGTAMKEANIFEAWADRLLEGTWATPNTPEQKEQLIELLSKELPVGPDATNATEQLYSLFGDDELFDQLQELAETDPDADAREIVIARMTELADNGSDPDLGEVLAALEPTVPEPEVADSPEVTDSPEPVAAGVAESAELSTILKYAGVPVKESVLTDSTGSTLEHIKDTFRRDVKDFTQTGNMSDPLYDALYDYYFDDMPYGTKKARDGDPYEWISDRFADDIGLDEGWKGAIAGGLAGGALGSVVPGLGTLAGSALGAYAGHKLGDEGFKDPDAEYKKAQKLRQTPPVAESDPIFDEGWKGQLAGGTVGTLAGGALGAVGGPIGAAVGGALGGTAGQMIGNKLGGVEDGQLNEVIGPVIAAGARALLPLLTKIGPALGRMASQGGKAAGQAATAAAPVVGQVAKQGAEIATKNALPIGAGVGVYQSITDLTKMLGTGVGEVYNDIGGAATALTKAVGSAVDEKTIGELALAAVKYAIPIGLLLALLYGGKKLIDTVLDKSQEETDERHHTQHGMDAKPGRDDYKDEKFADIRPMSFKQDPIQATTDRALKYSAQGVNKLRDLFREDEETVVENQDKFSALSGQYGHSGKLQKFDDVEQDVLARLKQLSGLVKTM